MSETPVETTDPAQDAPAEAPATPEATPVAEDAAPVRTKPRTVDSDEPSLGWTVQSGTPFVDNDAAPGQILPAHIAAGQPVVGGALYVEDENHPQGYQQLVQ